MPTVYDREGNPVELPAEQMQAALASGQYGVPKDQDVPVFSPDGQVGTVKGDKLHEALGGGFQLASDADLEKAKLEKQYGGVGGAATAATLEGLGTATLGLSDVLGSTVGGESYRKARKGYREVDPNATLLGGVGGAIIPSLLTGGAAAPEELGLEGANLARAGIEGAGLAREGAEGASALGTLARGAGKVLAAPANFAARAGGGVEAALKSALGADEDASLVSAIAKRMLAKGAGAATETAIMTGGQQLGEDALGDPDANGEKLLAAMGHGALFGFAGGAGLTAAGELGSAILGRAKPTLSHMAEEQAVRALEPHAAGARRIAELPGGARGLGRRLLDDGIIQPGETVEQVAARISTKTEEAGARVGKVYDTLDESGVDRIRVKDIADRVKSEVLPDLEKLREINEPAISKVQNFMKAVERFAGVPDEATALAQGIDRAAVLDSAEVSFRQMQDLRTTLRKSINWKGPAFAGVEDKANEALKDVYGALSKELDAKAEQAAGKMGGSLKDELKDANLAYRQYITADQTAQNALRLKEGRNIAAPSTKAAGLAAGIGLLAHGVSGGMSALGAAGAAVGNHLWKERGATASAALLDKLSALRGVERASKAVDREIDRGVAGMFREGRRAPVQVETMRHPYRDHAQAITRAAAANDAHAAAIANAASPLTAHAPATSRAFQSSAMRATQYLASKVPKRLGTHPSLTPQFDQHPISPIDEANYGRAVQAVHDPMSVLKDLGEGRATRDQIDSLRQVYPAIYAQVVSSVQDRLADAKHPLDYVQQLQIGLLLGMPANASQEPAFVQSMQSTYAQQPSGPQPQAGKPPRGAPKREITAPAKNTALSTGLEH